MSPGTTPPLLSVKALAFDVFGTVVNWRASVVEELTLRAHRKLHSAHPAAADVKSRLESLTVQDWGRFAQEWRDSYKAFTTSFDPDKDDWKTIDAHHRDSLVALLEAWDLEELFSQNEIESLSLVWHRLAPWPDAPGGLRSLGEKFTTATLSNGNISLLQDLCGFGNLSFGRLFSAETFHAYKPNPATYLGLASQLGMEPCEVAMVAAHLGDLKAASECGLRTIYVQRADEEAWGEEEERFQGAKKWVDLWVTEEQVGLVALARSMEELVEHID